MRATITYTAGKSCWIGKHRFKLNVPVLVTDRRVIQRCKDTSGFSVEISSAPKKVVREVVKKTG